MLNQFIFRFRFAFFKPTYQGQILYVWLSKGTDPVVDTDLANNLKHITLNGPAKPNLMCSLFIFLAKAQKPIYVNSEQH